MHLGEQFVLQLPGLAFQLGGIYVTFDTSSGSHEVSQTQVWGSPPTEGPSADDKGRFETADCCPVPPPQLPGNYKSIPPGLIEFSLPLHHRVTYFLKTQNINSVMALPMLAWSRSSPLTMAACISTGNTGHQFLASFYLGFHNKSSVGACKNYEAKRRTSSPCM